MSRIDGTKVGVAAMVGLASRRTGAITQAITGSAKVGMKIGAGIEIFMSPGVANADPVMDDSNNPGDRPDKEDKNNGNGNGNG